MVAWMNQGTMWGTLFYVYRGSIYGLICSQLKKIFLRKLTSDKGDIPNIPNTKNLHV